jgi:hypothetical protein
MKKIFLICIWLLTFNMMYGQPSGWQVNSAAYEYSMTMTAEVEYNGMLMSNQNDTLGAFVDGECRGIAEASWVDSYGKYMFFLTVFSNNYSGDSIEFRYYSHGNQTITKGFSPVAFVDGKNLGTASDPFIISGSISDNSCQVVFEVYGGESPLEGAKIQIDSLSMTTDSSGLASFRLKDSTYDFHVTAAGFSDYTDTLEVAGSDVHQQVNMQQQTYPVIFTVMNDSTGVEGVSITLDDQTHLTDSTGKTNFEKTSGTYAFAVKGKEYDDTTGTVTVTNDTLETFIPLAMSGYEVLLTITGAGESLQGARVSFNDSVYIANSSGQVSFRLKDSTYDYRVTADGFLDYADTLEVAGSDVHQQVNMQQQTYPVIFTVMNDSTGVEGISVTLDDQTYLTDSTGKITFEKTNGTYSFAVKGKGYNDTTGTVTVNDDTLETFIPLEMSRYEVLLTITGGGDSLQGARVNFNDSLYIADSSGQVKALLTNGVYFYTVSAEGFEDFSDSLTISGDHVTRVITLDQLTGINTPGRVDVMAYPNPVKDRLILSGEDLRSAELANLQGQIIFRKQNLQSNDLIDLSGFSPGIYLLRIRTSDNAVHTIKLIKQ